MTGQDKMDDGWRGKRRKLLKEWKPCYKNREFMRKGGCGMGDITFSLSQRKIPRMM